MLLSPILEPLRLNLIMINGLSSDPEYRDRALALHTPKKFLFNNHFTNREIHSIFVRP